MTLADLVRYSRISRRQIERFLSRSPDPLPHVKLGRIVRVKQSEFDAWFAGQSEPIPPRPARSVDEIIAEVKARHRTAAPARTEGERQGGGQ